MFGCRVHQKTNDLIDKLHVVQNCQVALIHASQIDWSVEPELCKLLFELGQPLPEHTE